MNTIVIRTNVVICGGGMAGCLLANKLSNHKSVVLLESGKNADDESLVKTPNLFSQIPNIASNELLYPGGAERLLPNRTVRNTLVTGGILGGGSSVNGMQFVKGDIDYYNELENTINDPDFGVEKAKMIFKELENYKQVAGFESPDDRGENGELNLRQCTKSLNASRAFVEAAYNKYGINEVNDYNELSENTRICSSRYWQMTQKEEGNSFVRDSASTAFIKPLIGNSSSCDNILKSSDRKLTVYTETIVNKVLFRRENNKNKKPVAYAVVALQNGHQLIIYADKIILSAGFYSPLILQRSGIGPKDVLDKLCIETIVYNENVGKNILNHPQFQLVGTGTTYGLPDDPQAFFDGVVFLGDDTLPENERDKRAFQLIGLYNPSISAFIIIGLHLIAVSKGETYITNKNPVQPPYLDFKYLSDNKDLESMKNMVEKSQQILLQMGLNNSVVINDDFIKNNYAQAYHWVGGCRIAPSPASGVIDNNFAVYGIENLYVVDGSSIPLNPSANTGAPIYHFAAVAADKFVKMF